MEYQQYICEICGEPYLGTSPPSRCPFCGAYEEKIVEAEKWKPIWGGEVSEVARKHLEAALQLEVGNTNFYMNVAKAPGTVQDQKMFKILSKIEREHAEVIVKFLGAQMPDFKALETEKDKAKETIEENLAESHMRETRAINAYKVAFSEVEDEKVKLLFGELIKIESDHLKLSE
jgi:rubrerythrin